MYLLIRIRGPVLETLDLFSLCGNVLRMGCGHIAQEEHILLVFGKRMGEGEEEGNG